MTETFELTDLGSAQLFAEAHGDRLRYVRARGRWLTWSGGRWRVDQTGEAERAAKDVARRLLVRAAALDDDRARRDATRWALTSQAEARQRAMLKLAETEPGLAVAPEQLDADPWLLSCGNGTLDLRTGDLHNHDPEDLISLGSEVDYDPEATCPRWLHFLREVFNDDQELIGFVRRAAGYSLTADTHEHVVLVLHGDGCNGKTTFVETFQKVVGDLACTSAFDTFVRAGDRGGRNDIARLHRARMVVAAESGEGRLLDEATVKLLSGGDTVAARFLYSEFFEFRPAFKIWLVTNHKPRVDGDDEAIWRRLRLVPFEVDFLGREDDQLAETLEAELPGIFTWAVAGCLEWQRHGLGKSSAVETATREYRDEEDVLGAFIAERCKREGEVEAAALREAYTNYCDTLGERALAANALGKRLARQGFAVRKGAQGKRVLQGLSLRPE
jgi:putative DNA primase/helicase